MIVRAVLDDRRLIEKMDFFNDGKNTLFWLQGLAVSETGETARKAIRAAFALRDEMADWEFRRAYGCVPADIPKIRDAANKAAEIAESILNDEFSGTYHFDFYMQKLIPLKKIIENSPS